MYFLPSFLCAMNRVSISSENPTPLALKASRSRVKSDLALFRGLQGLTESDCTVLATAGSFDREKLPSMHLASINGP